MNPILTPNDAQDAELSRIAYQVVDFYSDWLPSRMMFDLPLPFLAWIIQIDQWLDDTFDAIEQCNPELNSVVIAAMHEIVGG